MRTKIKLAVFFTYILLVATVRVAFAQNGDPPPGPCGGEGVAGRVVAVDEATGAVTVETSEGVLCTVTLSAGNYAHPIVALLGQYFDDLSAENLVAALQAVQAEVVCEEDDTGTLVCQFAGDEDPEPQPATVVAVVDNGDGTFTIELAIEGMVDHIFITTDDPALADGFSTALDTLMVMWELNPDGSVREVGDQIATYHEEGMGFGVLTKLYAMAQASQEACMAQAQETGEPCGVTVEELVADFQSGVGMGQLFKEYGKPSMVGVGHVRKALQAGQEGTEGATGPGQALGQQDKDKDRDRDRERDRDRDPSSQPGPKEKNKDKQKDKNKGGPAGAFTPPGWRNKPSK